MDEENKKINLESFFDKVDSVEEVANSALTKANSNLGIINDQKELIESLSISIEAMQTKIRDIANYIIIERKLEKDLEEDRRLEAEDAEQKRLMSEKAALMGKRGPQGEPGQSASPQEGGGGFMGGLMKFISGVGGLTLILPALLPVVIKQIALFIRDKFKKIFKGGFDGLGKNFSKLFNPGTKLPIVGQAFTDLKIGTEKSFSGAGDKFAKFVDTAFTSGGAGGPTGASSGSNMGVTDFNIGSMNNTLEENNLVEEEKYESFEESLENASQPDPELLQKQKESGERMEKVNTAYFDLQDGKITQEQYDKVDAGYRKFKEGTITEEEFDKILDEYSKDNEIIEEDSKDNKILEGDLNNNKKDSNGGEKTFNVEVVSSEVKDLNLEINKLSSDTDSLTNYVANESGVNKVKQDNSVLVQSNTPNTTNGFVKDTRSFSSFANLLGNEYLSINNVKFMDDKNLPPEIAKMLR